MPRFRTLLRIALLLGAALACRGLSAQVDLNTEQRIWVSEHRVVRVAIDPDGRPFAFRNEHGQPDGFGWECVTMALRQVGITCQPYWTQDQRKALQAREADVIAAMNADSSHYPGVEATAAYVEVPDLLLVKRGRMKFWGHGTLTLGDLNDKVVAVPSEAYVALLKERSPRATVLQVDRAGREKSISDLSAGRVDVVILNSLTATDLVLKTASRDVIAAGNADQPFRIAAGVRSDWPALGEVISKAYAGLGDGAARRVQKHWDIFMVEQVGWRPTRLQMVLAAVALAGLLAWSVISRNRTLKRTVKERTAQLELAKQEIQDKLDFEEALFNTIPYPVFYKDTEARYLGCNRAYEEAFGIAKREMLGKTAVELGWFAADVCRAFLAEDHRLLAAPAKEMNELRLGPPGKELRDYLYWKVSFPRRGGRVGGLLGVLVDITELKQAEAKIRAAEERLREITNSVPGAVWQYRKPQDGTPSYAFMSQGVEQLMGLEPEAVQKDFEAVVGRLLEADRPSVEEGLSHSAKTLSTWSQDFRVRAPDGMVKWLHGEAIPQRTEDGGVLWNGYWVDVTDRKRLEQSLAASLKELQETQASLVEAQKMASLGQLVTGVAHELNTPLGIALTSATHLVSKVEEVAARMEGGNLRKTDLERLLATQSESSALILRNLERSAQLVQRFKQVAADQDTESLRRFALKEVLDAAVNAVQASRRPGSCAVSLQCDPAGTIYGYSGALAKAVQAVLENACDHAGAGAEARLEAREDGAQILISVQDSGPGMDPATRAHAFDPFFTTSRGAGHVGLGLPIAYNLVTFSLQGGIELDSAPGRGTMVRIRIPKALPDPLMGKAT